MVTETLRWRFEDASLHMPEQQHAQHVVQLKDPHSLDALYRQARPAGIQALTSDNIVR